MIWLVIVAPLLAYAGLLSLPAGRPAVLGFALTGLLLAGFAAYVALTPPIDEIFGDALFWHYALFGGLLWLAALILRWLMAGLGLGARIAGAIAAAAGVVAIVIVFAP